MKRVLAIAGVTVLGVFAITGSAQAKACGTVSVAKPGWSWVVGGDGMSCRRMRYWTKSMVLGKGRPRGWQCHKRGKGPGQSGGCSRGPNGTSPFFIYYPPH